MSRRFFYYPVPDDFGVMMEVVSCLEGDDETVFGWRRLGAFIVAVADVKAIIYLRASFEHRPTDIDGLAMLESHEVYITDADRPECERLLAENCPSPTEWFDLLEVSFADDDEHRAFGAAYTLITRLPNAFTPVPSPLK